MFLRIGGKVRPFNEADATVSYQSEFDGLRRLVKVKQTWQIDGNVLQQSDATQSNMTAKLNILEQDFLQYRPDLVFLEDNGSTPSKLALYASQCLDGPRLTNFSFPKNANKVYAIAVPYTATMEADVAANSSANPILEFSETVEYAGDGGWERVHVGGAINFPEEQIGVQHNVYRYRQTGSALGLFNYPNIPPAIWPASLKRPDPRVSFTSPEIVGFIDQRFRISWTWEFESAFPLVGRPHRFI